MRRWALLLFAIVAVLWFWRPFGAGEAVARGEALESVAPATSSVEGAAAGGQQPALLAAPAPAPPPATAPDETLVASVRQRDPRALAQGYRKLLDLPVAAQAALADGLAAAAGDDLASALAALGEGNAFLHSEPGRQAARRALRLALAEQGESATRGVTGIIERAMRGVIEKADVAAVALVDEVYASMQGPLNRTVFNPEFTAGSRSHVVAGGETLDGIAAGYRRQGLKVDALTLGLFNRISDPTKLRRGQVLKVPVQPITTVVEKRSYLMAMYLGDVIFRLYWVGHGKDDRTPETTFTVGTKQHRPDWFVDGRVIQYGHPDNILGDYFVKFEHPSFQGYGAHGTPEPETIGTMASRGCIRMRDADIREFFEVVPRGSPVHVRASQVPGAR